MNQSTAFITLSRKGSSSNRLRRFVIELDGQAIGRIGAGESKQFRLPAGHHRIAIRMDFYKSPPLEVDLQPNRNLALTCGDRSPESLKEVFSLKGLEKSLNSLVKPGQYLYLETDGLQDPAESSPQLPESDPHPTTPGRRSGQPACSIFVSYRREDSREITGRICDRLNAEFGRDTIFRDVDSIPAGVDFREHITNTLGHCSALLAIIGNRWLEATNSRGQRRLELEDDPLRMELETALKQSIPVIPVLVKNGHMPEANELPECLQPLAYRNAITIPAEPYFHYGVDRLIEELEKSSACGGESETAGNPHFCIRCGNPLAPGHRFCIHCGQPVKGPATAR
ncbi:MAG: TIR domain-containing protein [Sedimenticola sp.]|nr:TIR domain-containing protein [Sedimenticola sp.]